MENTQSTANSELRFTEAVAACQNQISEAMKILATNSCAMQFIELMDIRPVNNKEIEMRLNTKDGGGTVYLEYNPWWILRINEPSILAFFFYSEIIRIAMHHCTDRRSLPAQSQYMASNLICFEDRQLLQSWKDEVKEVVSSIPSAQQIEPILRQFGFRKDKDWFLEKLKAYIEKAINEQQQQQQQQQQGSNQNSNQNSEQSKQSENSGNGSDKKENKNQQNSNGKGDKTEQKDSKKGNKSNSDNSENGDEDENKNSGNDKNDKNQNGDNGDSDSDSDSDSDGEGNGNGNGNGNSDGQGDTPDVRGNNVGNANTDRAKAVQEYFDGSEAHARRQTENWGENTMLDESVRYITEHMGSNPELWGKMPAGLQELIMARNKKKFDPTIIVRHFKQTIKDVAREQNRCKVNRRHPDNAGKIHKMKCSMGFFTDVSGSMSDSDVAMGQAFMTNFIKHVELYYADWDCSCTPLRRMKKDPLKHGNGMEITGRGGTNPQCIIDRLEQDHEKLGGLVLFTDCGFNWPRPANKWLKRIFIIGTAGCCEPPDWCRHFLNIKDIRKWYEANS